MREEGPAVPPPPVGYQPGLLRHVAIIMDGNGRWAGARGLPRNEGHRHGVENVKSIIKAAKEAELSCLTLFAFSAENWNRPRAEVSTLMRLLEHYLKEQAKVLREQEIRLRVLGRKQELPPRVAKLIRRTEEETAHYTDRTLALALNYGSRTEVVDAMRAYAEAVARGEADPATLDWAEASRYLYSAELPDPDLVIRTSGEHRVSNFLLLQSAYAEYYFSRKYWPDFGPDDFYAALMDYARRERRFGKTGEQIRADGAPQPQTA
ncbi:MAG: di-trans,poly-cis-decaprenylcistransferase [Opitutales bacterium]|nr:di-trans,poly-cis-decaprenylcistransferase [Opitutales bacterium]